MWRNILTFVSIGLVVGFVIVWNIDPIFHTSCPVTSSDIPCPHNLHTLVDVLVEALKYAFIIALGIAMIAGSIGGWSQKCSLAYSDYT